MFGIGLARRIRSRVADSPFSRGVTQLALATLAGQAIILMAIPLLTRLYDPASFGVAGVFSSITAIFYPLSSLRYELAIPLPKPDEDAANLWSFRCCCCSPRHCSLRYSRGSSAPHSRT